MALAPEKLRILTFPQSIDGKALELRVLLMPTQRLLNVQSGFPSQLNPGTTVNLPSFIAGSLDLTITAIRGLASYPFSSPAVLAAEGTVADMFPSGLAFPAGLPAVYEGLGAQFKLDTSAAGTTKGAGAPLADNDGIRKYLPRSYRSAFNFTIPRTEFARTDDAYHCAIKRSSTLNPAFKQSPDEVTWGRIVAFCLRQPLLAERIGLLHRLTLTLPADDYFKDGGWVYASLASGLGDFDIVNADIELRQYAARIPTIDQPRQVFAAVLFPVVPGPAQPNGDFDTLKIEAADYDDGFAKIVHAVQPVSANVLSEEFDGIHVQKDIGVRLGWDDEQLLIWQNRQMLADPATPGKRLDAPLGAFFYRVDVREKGNAAWRSLVRVRNKATLTLGGQVVAPAQTAIETGVQVFPSRINGEPTTSFWLPSYFTQWYGPSLVLPDARAAALDESGALGDPGSYADANIPANPGQKGNLYEPLLPADCPLKYGHEYEFRVRLGDLAGGGPDEDAVELNDAPAASSSIVFKRHVVPKQLTVTPEDPQVNPNSGAVQFYEGTSFTVRRPRLGYPALLFTELDTDDAFQKLLDDRAFLHTGKVGSETIKEQREVSYFDPDVDRFLVLVEVKTLRLDNLASLTGREAFIPLYSTFRSFDADPQAPFALELEYRDANVIAFGNKIDLGDLQLSQADIDNGDTIVLPRSRDIRITLVPVCSDKPALPEYFGFQKTFIIDEPVQAGEPVQFFVREDASDEQAFFAKGLESHELQGIYLQPDPPQVNNASTVVAAVVAGTELAQSTVMQRLAAALDVDSKGLTLFGRPGARIQFGCSRRIRHTLAPDGASLTFSTTGDLFNHWLSVLSFDLNRDWTWDGLSETGIEIARAKQFTDEPATAENEVVGYVQIQKTANRIATTDPDRSRTRVVFIDAVEPKKDQTKPTTAAHPFPNTIDLTYTVTPHFIASVTPLVGPREAVEHELQLPVTTPPKQVLKVVAAGYALSAYQRTHDYSETAVRQRYLWFEFDEPIQDPNDTCFARVLGYAPDPLLSFPNPDQMLVRQEDPPLAIDPELIRVITKGHGNDNAGIDAMQPMTPETADPSAPLVKVTPVHYLLPLPPGLHTESGELFGFFTYELRVGHTGRIWSTAQGRFGHPTRISGVQHPAPPLACLVDRTPSGLSVTAPYAVALFGGRNVTSRPPKTEIWGLLYAQLKQADGKENRNILLAEARLAYQEPKKKIDIGQFLSTRSGLPIKAFNSLTVNLDAPATGAVEWSEPEIRSLLEQFNLDPDTSLSVLAVEMMPRYDQYVLFGPAPDQSVHPLSRELGQYRILRASRLVAAPSVCCENC